MNSPDRPPLRGFKVWLVLAVVVSVALQMRTGSHSEALVLLPVGLVFVAYMGPAIVRARRDRRANGAPRPRVIYPLTFKVAGVAVLLGLAVMFVLFFTEKGQAFGGEHSSLKNAIEGATVLALIAVSQWQRSIIHGQLGANWSEPADLPSSNANGGRRQS